LPQRAKRPKPISNSLKKAKERGKAPMSRNLYLKDRKLEGVPIQRHLKPSRDEQDE
jgi:hypothetical protein